MNKARPSLLERAADLYDFASGLPMTPPTSAVPQPRPRPAPVAAPVRQAVPARPEPAPALHPESVRPEPIPAEPVRPTPIRPTVRPTPLPVSRETVELDFAKLAASGALVPDQPGGSLAEEMRLIKRRLLSATETRVAAGDEAARLVLVASGKPGEGKTFTALNLALSIAGERDRNVLLVDGDNAKPDLLKRLGVDGSGLGFIDALADPALDPESLVTDTDIEGLTLLGAGRRERRAPELLASARARDVLERLIAADPRRIVLFDSAPALASSATVALAAHVGQALVVVKADQTSESDLRETLDLLSPCEHISLVFNGAAFQVSRDRYGKYEEYR